MNHVLFNILCSLFDLWKVAWHFIFNFLPRCLLLFLSCTCASVHTIPCSKLECWCFTHWHPDKPAQLTCLWYARKFLFIYYFYYPSSLCLFLELPESFNEYQLYSIPASPRMVARYAPPISYNFLNLIRLGPHKTTIFEQVILLYLMNPLTVNSLKDVIFLA